MIDFIQNCLDGLAAGAAYALLGVGFTLIFGVLRRANLAYGPAIMLGAYAATWVNLSFRPGMFVLALLTIAGSPLGEIVIDGDGMTVYMFDSDTQGSGTSTCEGECATNWSAVTSDSEEPIVEGVTGEVGTITGVDGSTQVTLNGWPLYYFSGDAAVGDANGQGMGGVWWVLSPAGEPIRG